MMIRGTYPAVTTTRRRYVIAIYAPAGAGLAEERTEHRVLAEDLEDARRRAVQRRFGRSATYLVRERLACSRDVFATDLAVMVLGPQTKGGAGSKRVLASRAIIRVIAD